MEPVVVQTYRARTNAEASAMFAHDASVLGTKGYVPGAQTWVGPGMARLFLTPLVLIVAGYFVGGLTIGGIYGAAIGAAIGAVYLATNRPQGTLTVTYSRPA